MEAVYSSSKDLVVILQYSISFENVWTGMVSLQIYVWDRETSVSNKSA